MEKQKSIGIFDSGIGGLSIARAIKHILPEENLVYFADVAFSPYGNKSRELINQRSADIANFLVNQNCKLVVMACNTATVNSINNLRSKLSIPIVGVEPAIKPAALQTKTGVIGVLATQQTLISESFLVLKANYSHKVKIATKACPEFVSLVESLDLNSERAKEITKQYIGPLISQGCDQIVLGCTHFSFLKTIIKEAAGSEVCILDTATPVALEVQRRLQSLDLNKPESADGKVKFWTSGDVTKTTKSISELWQQNVDVAEVNSLTSLPK